MIYDFSSYLSRKREQQAATAVLETVLSIEKPGSVIELKTRVQRWFSLYSENRKVS